VFSLESDKIETDSAALQNNVYENNRKGRNYGRQRNHSNLAATGVYSKYNTKAIDTSDDSRSSSYMNFSDYLEVLAAQMSNQDFNDPMSDSEFLQQMASYSLLESINAMTKQTNISYASSCRESCYCSCNGVYDTGIVDLLLQR
jgi:hypothetical protein